MNSFAYFFGRVVDIYRRIDNFEIDLSCFFEIVYKEKEHWFKKHLSEQELEQFDEAESYYFRLPTTKPSAIEIPVHARRKYDNYSFNLGALIMLDILSGNGGSLPKRQSDHNEKI